jgi:hypothetical protein
VLDSKVKILDGKVEEGKNKFIFDRFPDDSGHLISIEFSNRIGNFDFGIFHDWDKCKIANKIWI